MRNECKSAATTDRGSSGRELSEAVKSSVLRHGEVEAARQLDIARSTVTRVAAGLPVHRRTIALVAAHVGVDDGLRPRAAPAGGRDG